MAQILFRIAMNIPDRIFALGGAGKAITYQFLETDWVQESVLQPRPEPEQLTVTIIDTAEEEKNRDLERIQEIEAGINETREQLRDTAEGRPGEINIEYLLLTENIQLHDQKDLIGDDTVPRIASGRGMNENDWWIRPEYINENLNFATGVVRKRGLGKGLYYKSYAEDDDVRTGIDLPNRGEVAVIAGIGGGTGSGILLDIAADLKRTQRSAEITLFAVLPNDEEGEAEKANAHAALSEMEYLSLQGDDLFEDRILVPIDPTGFGGKTGNILQSSEALVEFDRAMVYLITAYYNNFGMEDPFAQTPSYAPFIIGIPQILRYNVDAIKEAKSTITDLLRIKEDAIEAENELYDEIKRFFAKHGIDTEQGEFHDTDLTDLQTRLDNVKSLLDLDLFEELEYESVSVYKDIIRDAELESDDITEQIEVIRGSIRAGTTHIDDDAEKYVDSIDKRLGDIVRRELKQIARRAEVIQHVRAVTPTRIENTISYLILLSDEGMNPGVRLKQLEQKLEEAQDRQHRLKRELEETTAELEEQRDEQRSEIDHRVESWQRDIEPLFEEYQEFQSLDIYSRVDTLVAELEAFASDLEQAEEEAHVQAADPGDIRTTVNQLSDELEQLGINITDEATSINSSIEDIKKLKTAFLTMNSDQAFYEQYLPITTPSEEERENARKDYQMIKARVDDAGIFSVTRTGDNLSINVEFDGSHIATTFDGEIDHRQQEIVDELRHRVDDPTTYEREFETLRQELEHGTDLMELAEIAEDILTTELLDVSDIKERKQELEAELEETTEEATLYQGTVNLFEELNNRREAFEDNQEQYVEIYQSYTETDDDVVADSGRDQYHYIKNIKPNNVLQLRDDSTIAQSSIFDNKRERQRLRSSLEELAENIQSSKYNGLRKRRVGTAQSRYNEMKIVVGVLSQAIDEISEEADLESVFQGAFNLGPSSNNFASFPAETGGRWDIGLSVFIGGVFLDNIRAEVEPDGYQTGYQIRDESDDTDILVHHALGLDEGYFIRREEVLNMENPNDVAFYLRDEGDVRTDLLTDKITKMTVADRSPTDIETATAQSNTDD